MVSVVGKWKFEFKKTIKRLYSEASAAFTGRWLFSRIFQILVWCTMFRERKTMEIKNMTLHAINLLVNGEYVEYPPCGVIPRISTVEVPIEGNYPFEAVRVEYGDIQDLPDEEEGVVLIVSKMCADARPHRRDLWYPTRLVRDDTGRIVGCDALARLEP